MKKIFACVLAVCPMVASADYLDDKIASLTQEKLNKIAKLEECQKSTKGLKIAGITTLGVSAIGIGANIGEAVALNKLDSKIETAQQTKSDLDIQITDIQRKKVEGEAAKLAAQSGVNLVNQPVVTPGVDVNNTCGTKTCDAVAPTQSGLDLLNATEAVCKDGNWVAKTCKENYSGTQQTCTLNGATVTYIDSCKPVVTSGVDVNNTCGTKICDAVAPTQSGLDLLNATEAVCKDGNWVAKTCKENYSGTQQTCTLNGATVTYIDSCRLTAPTEKQCPQVTDEWKAQNNAKSGACDTTTGKLYITECADTHTEVKYANGRITECQQKQEQTQPVVQERKHHEMCSAEETAAIPNAATAWWSTAVKPAKCVARSCKPGSFLWVKGNASQGECKSACPAWQIKSWSAGGQACDTTISQPEDELVVKECTENKEAFKTRQHAKEVACDTNRGIWYIVECADNYRPDIYPGDRFPRACVEKEQTNRNTNIIPSVPVQKNNCPEGFVDIKGVPVYYGYQYMPYAPQMNVGIKVDGRFFYRCGVVSGVDSKTMSDAGWRKRKAEELALAKLKEMKYCNYKLEYSSDAVYK